MTRSTAKALWFGDQVDVDDLVAAHRAAEDNSKPSVIGMGSAGLRAAIAAHKAGCDVMIIRKPPWKDAHTVLAAGGINNARSRRWRT